MKKYLWIIICVFISVFGLFGRECAFVAYGAENVNISNLVVFVNFADTVLEDGTVSHAHSSTSLGKCFEDADYTFELFDGENGSGEIINKRAMKQYLDTVSYGELRLDNVFPQYDSTNHKMVPITLSENAQSYVGNDAKMIAEIISILNNNYSNSYGTAKLDYIEAGIIDNLMIVVACDDDLYNRLFSGHKSTYGGNETLTNGSEHYFIRDYTLVTEGGAYFGISSSGLLIHEFMHTLGYPDLYHRPSGSEVTRIPVGAWDIMSQENYCVQYPLAYMRQYISGWLDLPTITTSQTGYTLTAASASNENNKNSQAVILKTPYSDTEFFVIEYRKKGQTYAENSNSQDFDSRIPGSGIIVYRVNLANNTEYTNINGAPFMVYVYRPGDTYDSKGYENADADNVYLEESYLSLESGRTTYGSSDMTKSLVDNAITYSDGTNSGIVIQNVGSATGDTISFDIIFSDGNGECWTTLTNGHANESSTQIYSYMDSDGTIYYIKGIGNGTQNFLYEYDGSWTKLGSAPASYMPMELIKCSGTLYMAYVDVISYAHLAKWSSGAWVDVYKSAEYAGEVTLAQHNNQVYFSYTSQSSDYIKTISYNGSSLKVLGTYADSNIAYAANPSMTVVNGDVYILYREFMNNNALVIRKYNSTTGSWSDFSTFSLTTDYAKIYSNGTNVYVLVNSVDSNNGSFLYKYDVSKNTGWSVQGESFLDEYLSEMDLCFNGNDVYIVYVDGGNNKTFVKKLVNGSWIQIGTVLSNNVITGANIECVDSKLYVTYRSSVSNTTYIRSFQIEKGTEETVDPETPVVPERPVVPENPVVPETPIAPEIPSTPVDPETPVVPETPIAPEIPSTPVDPETPVVPSSPSSTKDGWTYEQGNWYYYINGYRKTGWLNDNGTWYYLNSDGVMQTGWIKDGGTWYYLSGSGAMKIGWVKDGSIWYYLGSSGAMKTGWIKDRGVWYYLSSSGAMKTGWIKDRGTWYYLGSSGAMKTGWIKDGGTWYYLSSSGAMKTGWIKDRGTWYYLNGSGAMQTGWVRIGGKRYYFNSSGAWIE